MTTTDPILALDAWIFAATCEVQNALDYVQTLPCTPAVADLYGQLKHAHGALAYAEQRRKTLQAEHEAKAVTP
jgi:hypothetical protein